VIDEVSLDRSMWRAAEGQLASEVEQANFFLARPRGRALVCYAMRVADRASFDDQSAVHIALTHEYAAELIRWAAGEGACLIELHSHVSSEQPCMSASDVAGLREWVPHVRWRLGAAPYAALVQSQTAIDGLVWSDGPQPTPLRTVRIRRRRPMLATGLSYERWYR
jgi:hypothetical protein